MIMPWGKYKGTPLEEIVIENPAYFHWLLGQNWIDEQPFLRDEIRRVLTTDCQQGDPNNNKNLSKGSKKVLEKVKECIIQRGYTNNEADIMLNMISRTKEEKEPWT